MKLTKRALTPYLSAMIALSALLISENSMAKNCCLLKDNKNKVSCITTSRAACLVEADYHLFRPTKYCRNDGCYDQPKGAGLNLLPNKTIQLQRPQRQLKLIPKKTQSLN